MHMMSFSHCQSKLLTSIYPIFDIISQSFWETQRWKSQNIRDEQRMEPRYDIAMRTESEWKDIQSLGYESDL